MQATWSDFLYFSMRKTIKYLQKPIFSHFIEVSTAFRTEV